MTNELPALSEAHANSILDDVVRSVITLRDEDGEDITLPVTKTLTRVFGDSAQAVAQLVLLGALRGHEQGLVDATPGTDRTDILVAALRRVHTPEMFGDCTEDGDHYPCKTAKMLDLVAGAPVQEETEAA